MIHDGVTSLSQNTLTVEDLPVHVAEVEFKSGLKEFSIPDAGNGLAFKHVRALVRVDGVPAGYALLPARSMSATELENRIVSQLGESIGAIEAENAGARLATKIDGENDLPFISVVVCTRDRPEGARRTLQSLIEIDYPGFEIVLVDNAPSDESTRDLVENEFSHNARVRYVRESRPGLSCARNRGLAEARSNIVAFTDDDVNVDKHWLKGIAKGFSRTSDTGCVTGLVPAATLETPSQLYFELRYSWGSAFKAKIYDLTTKEDAGSLYPYSAGIFGTGANFALDRNVVKGMFGFDEALGAGTTTGGGEDLDIFVRVILDGHRLVYEPSAIVTHVHRESMDDLDRQLFNYGCGLTAFLTKQFLHPMRILRFVVRVPHGAWRIYSVRRHTETSALLPRSVTRREFTGMLSGPFRYLSERRRVRSVDGHETRITQPASPAIDAKSA